MRPTSNSVRRQLMAMLLLTSSAVVLLTSAAYYAYEYFSFRRIAAEQITALGSVVGANTRAALAFENRDDATEMLAAFRTNRSVIAAALYDARGQLFARYQAGESTASLPATPGSDGFHFTGGSLHSSQPVILGEKRLGTLYLHSSLRFARERFLIYGVLVAIVALVSLLVAYLLSRFLQRQISDPVLVLANTARAVSEQHDYRVRAVPRGAEEFVTLTETFNHMLTQIEAKDLAVRESEARMRAVLNSSLNAVIVTADDGRIVDWNTRAERMFGWTREEAIGKPFLTTVFPEDRRDAHRSGMERARLAGHSAGLSWPLESVAVHRDGREFPVEIAINLLRTGERPTFCAFVTDITDRKRAQEQVARLNEELEHRVALRTSQLEAANSELEAFSYSVSHDLRAPLRHIDGFAAMLVEHAGPKLDATSQDYLARIVKAARRMSKLIEDLLMFSRQGRVPLKQSQVDLDDLLGELRQRFGGPDGAGAVAWTIDPLPRVWGDPSLLQQVFANLLDNAVKYTSQRPDPRIHIGTQAVEGGEAVVFVRDNGAGFDMRYVDRLFGVFQRLHTADQFAGTGVGLATVRRIVHRHGGRVWAEGTVDGGATFFVALPTEPPLNGNPESPRVPSGRRESPP